MTTLIQWRWEGTGRAKREEAEADNEPLQDAGLPEERHAFNGYIFVLRTDLHEEHQHRAEEVVGDIKCGRDLLDVDVRFLRCVRLRLVRLDRRLVQCVDPSVEKCLPRGQFRRARPTL